MAIDAHALASQRTGVGTYVAKLLDGIRENGDAGEVDLYLMEPAPEAEGFHTILLPRTPLWTTVRLAGHFARNSAPEVMLYPAHSRPLYSPARSVVTLHDLAFRLYPDHFTAADRLRLNLVTMHAARRADHFIANSETTRRDACDLLGIPPDRITTIHHGYDADFFRPASAARIAEVRRRFRLDRPYLICVATLQKRKNHERLIEAVHRLHRRGYDLDLVLVGGRGWLYDGIYRRVEELGMEERVRFTGYVALDDLPALYSGAEASVLVSLYEGFGLPVLEALGCGVPTVVSDVSSLPEVGGDAVVKVDPMDPDSIAEGLEAVLVDSQLRRRLEERRIPQLQRFSWSLTAARTLDVMRAVASSA